MPVHLPTCPGGAIDGVTVRPNSNEALALKAVRESPGTTSTVLADGVSLSEDALTGALYRLQKKNLLSRADDGTYDLESYKVIRLADALRPSNQQ